LNTTSWPNCWKVKPPQREEQLSALASADFEFDITEEGTSGQQETQDMSTEVEDAPVVRFLQKMLVDAINARASDLHFEPYEHTYRVRFRVDGELREITNHRSPSKKSWHPA
jgi:type IV pilus assembly protein PilB